MSRPAKKFYIRMHGAAVGVAYWMQNAQNWSTDGDDATMFATQQEAEAERVHADHAGPSETEVCELRRIG